jgi:hypothetical protein
MRLSKKTGLVLSRVAIPVNSSTNEMTTFDNVDTSNIDVEFTPPGLGTVRVALGSVF